MNYITSTKNSTLIEDAKLLNKKYRDESGFFLVEGEKLINEGLKADFKLIRLYILDKNLDKVVSRFESFSDVTYICDEKCMDKLYDAKSGQGIVGVFEKKQNCKPNKNKLSVILDNLQDPKNVGTILRTASACDFVDVYLINCADPYSPKSIRASMSGIFKVNLHFTSIKECENLLKDSLIICADMDGENIFKADFSPKNIAFIVGNEGNGISSEAFSISQKTVSIPMQNEIESLNVALSAGIIMYAIINK